MFNRANGNGSRERVLEEERMRAASPYEQVAAQATSTNLPPPAPVLSPPALQHNPHGRPTTEPYQAPELRRAHSNVDEATLHQMQRDQIQARDSPLLAHAGYTLPHDA